MNWSFTYWSSTIYIYIYIYRWLLQGQRKNKDIFKIEMSTKRFLLFNLSISFLHTCYIYTCMFPACCFHERTCVAQGILNGVLNETWTHSCFQYKWILSGWTCFYKGFCAFFLECIYFGLLYPSLMFDMFIVVSVCVCVLKWFWVSLTAFICIMGCFVAFKFTGSSFFFVNMVGIRSS